MITDVTGALPIFLQHFNRIVALATKVIRKWEGPVWDHEQTSAVALLSDEAIVRAVAYTMSNPVEAGLVNSARDWPGLTTHVEQLGGVVGTTTRPDAFFNPFNPQWPSTATLKLELPPRMTDPSEFRERVGAELVELEQKARGDVARRKWRVVGRDRVRRVSPYDRATSFEPLRGRNPTFATGRLGREAYRAPVQTLRAFRAAYREAMERWKSGYRDAVFPVGTWWMRVFHGAPTPEPARAA